MATIECVECGAESTVKTNSVEPVIFCPVCGEEQPTDDIDDDDEDDDIDDEEDEDDE